MIDAKTSYFILFDGVHKYYVNERNSLREVGDILLLKGEVEDLRFTTYESRFDFKAYLEDKNVFRSFSCSKYIELFHVPLRLKAKEASFLSSFDGETASLLDGLLFGHRETSASMNTASSLGLANLFMASGILYGLLLHAVERFIFLRYDEMESKVVSLGFGTVLLLLLPKKIGIWRVYLTRVASLVNKMVLRNRFKHIEIVSFVGILLLAFDASNAYQVGYLLGFGLGFVNTLSTYIIRRNKPDIRRLIRLLLVYMLVFPLSLGNGTLHFLYPFFASLLLPILSLFAFLGWLSFLSVPFRSILHSYAYLVSIILKSMDKLDFSIELPSLDQITLLVYYFSFVILFYFLNMKHNGMVIKILIANMALYLLSIVPIVPLCSGEVAFINVGQGDSILIRDGSHAALIDTGGNINFDMAKEVVIPFLRKKRIYHLDYLIASHGDFDHIGAKDSLLAHFPVDHFIDSAEAFPLTFGGVTLTNYNHFSLEGENESSLVLYTEFIDKKWLFTGDAPKEIEKLIIAEHPDLDCDILKAGHHGSKTSSCLEWLKTITPETAIISCGYKNHYGHPDKEVMSRFASLGIEVRRTDVEGTITYQKILAPKL
ncbi:MAG: ComEC family DNA internalization-related competence protein [Bacilli bacterium]|nr:ComEC family DNA internalization-related competence protein [Bacilli bacterium]